MAVRHEFLRYPLEDGKHSTHYTKSEVIRQSFCKYSEY